MNESGIEPIEYNVLIDQDAVETKTKGGLIKPDEILERDKHGQTRGTIIAVSPMAFSFDDWPDGVAKPQPGDKVAIAKHSGVFITGNDGKEYRVVKDKDIVAVIK